VHTYGIPTGREASMQRLSEDIRRPQIDKLLRRPDKLAHRRHTRDGYDTRSGSAGHAP
jgi:hypothetical protein